MSTSLLYHGFGIVGYQYGSQQFHGGQVICRIEQARDRLRCPQCGCDDVWIRGHQERTFRSLPIGLKPPVVTLDVARVWCPVCDGVLQVQIGFADPTKRSTRSFERYALQLSRHLTIKDVAEHLQVSWDTSKDIQASNRQRRFGRPKLHKLQQIAIDESAVGKGHRYLTVVLNLLSGAVVFVGDGKGVEALEPFWKRLRRARAKIQAVATARSSAYIRAVRDNLPKAVPVCDHFHVIQLFNDKLSACRRELHHQASSQEERQILKGTRGLLRKNPENLDEDGQERQRLEEALGLNKPLALAYELKEDLRQIWSQRHKDTARRVLRDWLARARAADLRMLVQFAATVEEHQEGILNYDDDRISTAPLEGTNNKIQLLKRPAYGFRDQAFFKLKILGLHETKHALVG